MPDWKGIVQERLRVGLGQDVVAELAAHLEEIYEQARAHHSDEAEALRLTLQEVDDWNVLATEIAAAKTKNKEHSMNQQRTKLWLPLLASITFTAVLLVVFDRIHAGPLAVGLGHLAMALQLAWFAVMPILGRTKSEEALMNPRTRSIWLPGFVTLTAASLFLFAEELVLTHDPSFYLTDLSLRPQHIVSGLPLWLYGTWLAAQILCGALGAFLSRRGGGSMAARVVAGAFPALMMFLLFALVIPISVVFERNTYVLSHPSVIALGMLIWAGGPAVALLIGAAPFLRELPLHQA